MGVIDTALSIENLFILNSFFFYLSEKAILDKIAIYKDIGVRGKGYPHVFTSNLIQSLKRSNV